MLRLALVLVAVSLLAGCVVYEPYPGRPAYARPAAVYASPYYYDHDYRTYR